MMLVDCQTCPVRDVHCADCMVTALAPLPVSVPVPRLRSTWSEEQPDDHGPGLPLDRAERRAVSAFLGAGLVAAEIASSLRAVPDHDRGSGQHTHSRAAGQRAAG
ncbi:MAG: hypothetical protein ABIR97_04710 [Terracoccus sp.]